MIAKYKWLFLAPAFALALFLGPLQRTEAKGSSGDAEKTTPSTEQAPKGGDTTRNASKSGIATASNWQIGTTLLGVLMLGAAGIIVFAKLKNTATGAGQGIITMRQSLRLSGKQALYAIQFDDKLLLLGECDGTLQVLGQTTDGNATADEAEVLARSEEDEGAVPRDMIIPRPTRRATSTVDAKGMENFKTLLAKARGGDILV